MLGGCVMIPIIDIGEKVRTIWRGISVQLNE